MTDLVRAINATLMPGFFGPELPGWLASELDAGLGSVCLFGSNIVDAAQTRALTDAIHAAGPRAIIATDEEGGDVTRLHHLAGSPYPAAALLGALDDVARTRAVASGIGADLADAGIDLDLAPVADVNSNPDNPVIGVRSFGASADAVARHVAAAVAGLQDAGVGATVKHFPGHGDTVADSHRELPVVGASAGELEARELAPFRAAIDAGTLAIMTSHILVPALDPDRPATMSPAILGMLRGELGFAGAIVSDALDMAGASGGRGIPEAAVLALAAGVDLLCIGTNNTAEQLAEIRAHILDAVASGRLPESRVRDAAARVGRLADAIAALRRQADAVDRPAFVGATTGVALSAAFWLRRPLDAVEAPVFVQLASEANIAAGDTAWGVGTHLASELDAALPGWTCLTAGTLPEVEAAVASAQGRPLVVQGRDLDRVPFLREASERVREQRPDAVLVDLGWPRPDAERRADVATFGSGRSTSLAVIDLLARGNERSEPGLLRRVHGGLA